MRVIYDIDAYPRMHNSYSFQHLYKILNSGFCAGVSTFNNNPSDFLYREEYDGLDYYVIIDNVGKTEAFGRDTLKKMSSQWETYRREVKKEISEGSDKSNKLLPTPRAGNPGSRPNQKGGKILAEEVGKNRGLKLQPAFVEWMQGYPTGWTDLNHLETP